MSAWAPVVGYEGLYDIARDGRVRGLKRGKVLSTFLWGGGGGYPSVSLFRDGRMKHRTLHDLLMQSFVGTYPPGMEINHKDGNKLNHALDNLEYVTRKGNRDHAVRTGLLRVQGEDNAHAKLTETQVREIRRCGGKIRDVGARFGVTHRVVSLIRRRLLWKHVA